MNSSPFKHAPDVFVLYLPRQQEAVTLQPFESSWGTTDELLCYADGIYIGRVAAGYKENADTLAIMLLPKVEQHRDYEWPEAARFESTLLKLALSVPGAVLRCERDADQETVVCLQGAEDLTVSVSRLIEFCCHGTVRCPTFSYGQTDLPTKN